MFADRRHSVRPDHSEVMRVAPLICARAYRACRPTEESCHSWAAALRKRRRRYAVFPVMTAPRITATSSTIQPIHDK